MSPKARQSKGKARLNRYEELVNQKQDQQAADLEIYIPPGPRLGDVVVEAKGLSKAYGDKVLYENVNFSLPKGGIVGVIGPNGAGKTTMFRMIIGKEKPDAGAIKVETLNGTVALSGFAKSNAEKNQAELLARNTKGVREVRNNLTVRP
jgi:ATPase subunit of ABC transporter with duplicated ATPase domains